MRVLLAFLIVLGLGFVGFAALAWHGEIAPIAPPARTEFDPGQIARGAELAAIGNCSVCHTAPGGPSYAGGFPVETPFGIVYGSNITPDADTGIGSWSEAAFSRALHRGIDRKGGHLYPAFPYDHYARLTAEDTQALYAFLMTRRPVQATTPEPRLAFPLNFRVLVAGWNLLFLDGREFRPDTAQSAAWNRGAYLAEGLGHCGACHTPRNRLGAEKRDQAYAGGESEGWLAPALDAASPAPVPWDEGSLFSYLKHGSEPHHGIAAGPMASVTRDLAFVHDEDLRAIATYMASRQGTPTAERTQRAQQLLAAAATGRQNSGGADGEPGSTLFAAACSQCHGDGMQASEMGPPLLFSTQLNTPGARNATHVVLEGIHPPDGVAGPLMPGFAGALSDAQLGAVLAYLRAELSDKPPWRGLAADIAAVRRGGTSFATEAP